MTGNQVANAQVMENNRHNKAAEAETERANKAMEDLKGQQLALDDRRLNLEDYWNKERNRIQEEYNLRYLELQRAQGQERLAIERALEEIQAREQRAKEIYQTGLIDLQRQELDLKDKINEETKRANKAQESLKAESNSINWWHEEINRRATEYQQAYWSGSLALGNLNAQITRENNLMLNDSRLLSTQVDMLNTQVNFFKAIEDTKIKNKQLGVDIANSILNGINNSLRGFYTNKILNGGL